ncbi:hypothetical protein, partial [Gordonia jinghuaiqii]|uniref:hypothetical protein n=1 Tax=Gordonia jinghuaiqii TaxID=2758710 RepID=UPI001CB79936
QDQTLHEKIAKQPTPKRAGISTQSGKQNLTNPKTSNTHPKKADATKTNKNIYIHKECSMPNWHQTIHHHTIEFSKNTHPPDVLYMRGGS